MNNTTFIIRNGLAGLAIFLVAAIAMSYGIQLAPDNKLNIKALLVSIAIPSGIAAGIFAALILLFKQQLSYLKALMLIAAEAIIFIILTFRFV